MIPNITRGGKIAGFLNYAVGPGRFNEHTNPRVVAGDDTVLAVAPVGRVLGVNDALDIANVLERPRKLHDVSVTSPVTRWDAEAGRRVEVDRRPTHMWQCSLSNGPKDEPLTDEAWQRICELFMERMGFVDPDGARSNRWVAIHHGQNRRGNDHVHIVMQMVREDGGKANVHHDAKRAQQVCAQLEREFGLAITEGRAAQMTVPHEKRHERERAQRERAPWVEKKELRRRLRAAVGASGSEAEFVRNVFSAGVMIQPRFAQGTTDAVVGYRVALAPPAGSGREPIWYAPSKLEARLSLPKVRAALGAPPGGDREAVAVWQEHHVGAPARRQVSAPSDSLAARVRSGEVTAGDLSAYFAGASLEIEGDRPGPLAQASENLARVARPDIALGYQARQMMRAASKDPVVGWTALLRQACRLSTVMMEGQCGQRMPQLVREHAAVVGQIRPHTGGVSPSAAKMGIDEAELRRIRSSFGTFGDPTVRSERGSRPVWPDRRPGSPPERDAGRER